MSGTVVYAARRIITLDPARPQARHVAVRDGRVLAVGELDALRAWGPFDLDERFADKVLMPGFVEGHSHVGEGVYWRYVYCGFFDRTDPDGRVWPGAKSIECRGLERGKVLPVHNHRPGGRLQKAGDNVQQRALAATGRTQYQPALAAPGIPCTQGQRAFAAIVVPQFAQ